MSGSFKLSSENVDNGGDHKGPSPVLILEFTSEKLAFYDSSVGLRYLICILPVMLWELSVIIIFNYVFAWSIVLLMLFGHLLQKKGWSKYLIFIQSNLNLCCEHILSLNVFLCWLNFVKHILNMFHVLFLEIQPFKFCKSFFFLELTKKN